MKKYIQLFLSSCLQMGLVAVNTLFIVKQNVLGLCITSFCISLVWSFNIKKIAVGNLNERLVYASGSLVGTLIGYLLFK